MNKLLFPFIICLILMSCGTNRSDVPVIGFVDAFEDHTLSQAKKGFLDALSDSGFAEKNKSVRIIYRNAQGNIPTLTQIVKYFVTEKVNLIAACPTLSAITAVQNTKDIPVFMMVSGTPTLMKVNDANGHPPKNLFGVGDNLDYIDTSFLLIPKLIKPASGQLTVGMIFNQSEPQSVEAIERIRGLAAANQIRLVSLPVNSSADVQLVTSSLLSKKIDAFFANPDNTVFSSFENIVRSCNQANVPIFTSEAGLVDRGAVAAYGADIYRWGYQAGTEAARYLRSKSTEGLGWEIVQERKKVYNPDAARKFALHFPEEYQPIR